LITMFTRARHRSLSWVTQIQSTPSETISFIFILIISCHLPLGLPNGLFPSRFPTQFFTHFSSPYACYVPSSSHPACFDHPDNIWWRLKIMKLFTVQFSPASYHVTRGLLSIVLKNQNTEKQFKMCHKWADDGK
jgi:hypothetical protein